MLYVSYGTQVNRVYVLCIYDMIVCVENEVYCVCMAGVLLHVYTCAM